MYIEGCKDLPKDLSPVAQCVRVRPKAPVIATRVLVWAKAVIHRTSVWKWSQWKSLCRQGMRINLQKFREASGNRGSQRKWVERGGYVLILSSFLETHSNGDELDAFNGCWLCKKKKRENGERRENLGERRSLGKCHLAENCAFSTSHRVHTPTFVKSCQNYFHLLRLRVQNLLTNFDIIMYTNICWWGSVIRYITSVCVCVCISHQKAWQ